MRWWLWILLVGCSTSTESVDDDDTVAVDDDDVADDDDHTPGPCTSWGAPEQIGAVDADWLDEISGLVVSRSQPGVLWVIEDSGNTPEVVALGFDGSILARVTLTDRTNRDWEDLALGPCPDGTCLFVADIGDNARSAPEVALLRFPEPKLDVSSPPETLAVASDRLPFRYAEGAQDAEALVIEPDGTPVVLTKQNGNVAQIYRLVGLGADAIEVGPPVELSTARDDGPVTLGVTGADLTENGTRLLVREYFDLQVFDVSGDVTTAADGVAVPFEPESQGEAVAWDEANRRYLTISEQSGGNPPIWAMPCVTR